MSLQTGLHTCFLFVFVFKIYRMFTTHPFCADVNGNYFAYLKTMDTFIKDNPDVPIFNVSYEETKQVSNYDSLATMA